MFGNFSFETLDEFRSNIYLFIIRKYQWKDVVLYFKLNFIFCIVDEAQLPSIDLL